ncbi:MAG: cytochrome-c oxidase [Burkholderiales bacterium]|nr:cytochrome-c oxidase [Burkholderiales bacterium]
MRSTSRTCAILGLGMGITLQFTLAPVHAHLLLLGWASLALAGIVYHLYPAASGTRLARWHFWLHNAGLPVFMVGLGFLLAGNPAWTPVVATGATVVVVGLVLFCVNVLVIRPSA